MKNKEKYFDKLIDEVYEKGYTCDFIKEYCDFKCIGDTQKDCDVCKEKLKKWLEQEYIEPKLSYDEYVILKNVDKDYKWIVRSESENLSLSNKAFKPYKKVNGSYKHWFGIDYDFECYNHLFQFIKWEDEKPYNIKELLEEYERFDEAKKKNCKAYSLDCVKNDLKYYLDTNEEKGVVYIPSFIVEKIINKLGGSYNQCKK